MNNLTPEIIDSLAKKLLFELTEEENKAVLEEQDYIKTTMDLINQIEGIENIEPMTHPFELYNYVLKDTIAEESDSKADIFANCDKVTNEEIEVPRVVN